MSDQRPVPRNRLKTRTGCQRCKQRRIKCDETYPHCHQCTRRGFDCPGYKRRLKWSSKYEVGVGDNSSTKGANSTNTGRVMSESATDAFQIRPPSPVLSEFTGSTNPQCRYLEGVHTTSTNDSLPTSTLTPTERQNGPSSKDSPNAESIDALLNMPILEQFSGNSDNATGWMEWADSSLQLSLPQPLEEQETGILRHYFVQVCRINSCFDSDVNFFRAEIGTLMASSPLIYHCVLSMSAAHFAGLKGSIASSAQDHRTKALSYLRSEIAVLKDASEGSRRAIDGASEALLGSILLGMTDGWHDPSFLGTTHLHGARILFTRWMSSTKDHQAHPTASSAPISLSRLQSFVVGVMVYWEAMASFLINQPLDATAYLDAFCNQRASAELHPNPWTGICTPLFVYLARAGTLARQRLLFNQLSIMTSRDDSGTHLKTDLLQSTRETEAALLQYRVPDTERIKHTADPLTPVSDLQRLAQIYRLTALLELYRNFPELLVGGSDEAPSSSERGIHGLSSSEKIAAMAVSTLTLVAAVSQTSGVNCLLTIPLTIAGSSLQSTQDVAQRLTRGKSSFGTLSAEIISISSHESVQLYWRDFVRTRLEAVRGYVGIASISRAREILEKVWARSDIQSAMRAPGSGESKEFIQWIEVMAEEKLETVLG